jgi:hypothetical protein
MNGKGIESKESRRHHCNVATPLDCLRQVERGGLRSVSSAGDGGSLKNNNKHILKLLYPRLIVFGWFLTMCRGRVGPSNHRRVASGKDRARDALIWHGVLQ